MQQLRESESELRQENIRLKEEILVIKKQKGLLTPNRYAPPAEQPQTMYFIAIAVIVGKDCNLFFLSFNNIKFGQFEYIVSGFNYYYYNNHV